jgi:hypothetical protein
MVVEHLSAPAASGNMNVNRKPDLVLALLYLEVCLGSTIPLGLSTTVTGSMYGLASLALLALGYVVFESARCARPLTGLLVGALGFAVFVIGHTIGNLLYFHYPGSTRESILFAAVVAGSGALLGLAAATVSWLIRRKRGGSMMNANPAARTGLRGSFAVGAVILGVFPFLESLATTLQLDLSYAIQRLLRNGGNIPGWQLSLDRQALIVLSVVAAYSVLRGRRWMRSAVSFYLAASVILAVVRLTTSIRLDSMIAMNMSPSPGYTYANLDFPSYPLALSDYIRACGIELAVRAGLCAIGVPWVFISWARRKSPTDAG